MTTPEINTTRKRKAVLEDVWGSGCINPFFLTSALVGGE
jgi:hypothetical protein